MARKEPIVAVGLLTKGDLAVLGQGFRRVYPLDQGTDFGELLQAIDDADRALHDCHARREER